MRNIEGDKRTVQESNVPVVVIVPPVVCHNLDVHTGIPFMPHVAGHLAGALVHAGREIKVFDCFGMEPHQTEIMQREFMLMGMTVGSVVAQLPETARVCHIYCRTIAEFIAVEKLTELIRKFRPDMKICLFENIHAVTSYSLRHIARDWIKKGVHCIIMGEPEDRVVEITRRLEDGLSLDDIQGIAFPKGDEAIILPDKQLPKDLDSFPLPAWEKFPLEGYWRAGFAHAPCIRGEKFLPILTSRGCPYRCTFCIAPEVNPKWRARSAANVVDEMEHFYTTLGVTDFHVSDLNPTVSEKRTREISNEILRRKLKVTWKLAQGTKIETIKNEDTLELMARSGCRFVSFSPESGSERLLAIMNKPFDHEHGLRMTRKMHELGIRTQAVFLGGVPGEEPEDRDKSVAYVKKLIRCGVDEISLVIFTPLPGAKLSSAINDFDHLSQCTPSPAWRKDYRILTTYRRRMYLTLFWYKFICFPRKTFREIISLLTRRFETKMEMSLFKQVKLYGLRYVPWIFPRLS